MYVLKHVPMKPTSSGMSVTVCQNGVIANKRIELLFK